jgi:hypothetical protein
MAGGAKLSWTGVLPDAMDEYHIPRCCGRRGRLSCSHWQKQVHEFSDAGLEPGKVYFYTCGALSDAVEGFSRRARAARALLSRWCGEVGGRRRGQLDRIRRRTWHYNVYRGLTKSAR